MDNKRSSYELLDTVRKQRLNAGLQPFKLVKYFSFSSLGVILIFTLILSWAISNYAREIILEQSEEYSVAFAENLNQQVFRRFVLITALRYQVIKLSNPEQFESLDRIIREIIQGMNVASVTIFDSKVNVISYSTIKELVGKEGQGGYEYDMALQGKTTSTLYSTGTVLNLLPGADPISCTLKTYIPFRQVTNQGEEGDYIMGVIEIVKDLSSDYQAILRLQGSIIFVSSVVMMVLFMVLQTIAVQASRKMKIWVEERLLLEEKLHQTERLAQLGSMVATVSHEIKSPLGIIKSTAEILMKRIKKVAPGNEHLAGIIVDETNRLNNITMEFLDFARPQQAKLVPGNVHDVIEKALRFIAPKASEQKVTIVKDLTDTPHTVRLDQELFYRALLNIFVNALQAMSSHGGFLKVTTNESIVNNDMMIEIRDDGKGMSESTIDYIFDPFFTDKHKGTGLGLAITKNIIDSHNGTIKVASTEGKGTSFYITLH